MEFSRVFLCWFVFIVISLAVSEGQIKLCPDIKDWNATTIYIRTGETFKKSLCLETASNYSLEEDIIITHKNVSRRYHHKQKNIRRINVIPSNKVGRKTTFEVTIANVTDLDFISSLSFKFDSNCQMCGIQNSSIFFTFNLTRDPASINTFVVRDKGSEVVSSIDEKEPATLLCQASGRPSPGPRLSLLNEHGKLLPANHSTNSISYVISSVACSDMGRYYCRMKDEANRIQEIMTELRVWGCAPQLCSHEQQNNTITSIVNQTVHVSVCLMSSPLKDYNENTDRTSVTFMTHENSLIFNTVNISIDNIQTSDSGQKTIKLKNYNGEFNYTFFLNVQARLDTKVKEQDQTTEVGFNPIYVGVPLGLLVLASIIGVVAYQVKKKQGCNKGKPASSQNRHFRDEGHGYVNEVPEPPYNLPADYTSSQHYEETVDLQTKDKTCFVFKANVMKPASSEDRHFRAEGDGYVNEVPEPPYNLPAEYTSSPHYDDTENLQTNDKTCCVFKTNFMKPASSEDRHFRAEGQTYANEVPDRPDDSSVDYTSTQHYEEIVDLYINN